MKAEEDDWDLPDVSEGYIMGLLHSCLKQCREAWAKPQRRFSTELGRLESVEEALTCAYEDESEWLAIAGSRSRRKVVSYLQYLF